MRNSRIPQDSDDIEMQAVMRNNYVSRGSSVWRDTSNQPQLVYLGAGKKKQKVDNVRMHSPFLNQDKINIEMMKPSDIDLNGRENSFDFEDLNEGPSLGKASSMIPVRPGKSSIRRGSLSNSAYFKKQLQLMNQDSLQSSKFSQRGYSTQGYGTSVYNGSVFSGSMYNHKSTFKRKKTKKLEKSGRDKLAEQKRSLTWTDRSMIAHILTYIVILFSAYAAVFLVLLNKSTDLYSERLNFIMKESFRSEKAYHISGVLNSTITQAMSYFDLQAQLIEKQNTIIQDIFFNKEEHQLAWQDRIQLDTAQSADEFLRIINNYNLLKSLWIVHRDAQTGAIGDYGKKINALGPMWPATMAQDFGLSGTLSVEQIYIQLETDDAAGGVIFSYPGQIPSISQKLTEKLKTVPTVISEIYTICKREEAAVVNYAGFDIAKQKERRVTVAYPIKSSEQGGKPKFRGAVIWESQLNVTFKQTIIPESFTAKDYPFLQFRMPQHPDKTSFNLLNQKYLDVIDPKLVYIPAENPTPDDNKEEETTPPPNSGGGGGGKEFSGPWVPSGVRRMLQVKTPQEQALQSSQQKQPEKTFSQIQSEKFKLERPLGEIVHEINRDDLLAEINFSPEYIDFVNRMQEIVFSGEKIPQNLLIQDYTHFYIDKKGKQKQKQYRFFAQSFQSERDVWENDSEPFDLSNFSYSRKPIDQNMLVFIIEDVSISQDIYSEGLAYFVDLEVSRFEFGIICLSIGIIFYLVIFVLVLIRLSVVGPITELTDQIMNPKRSDKMEKFVQDIQRRVRRRSIKKSARVDEVEQLRILFSQFFTQTKDIQNELADSLTQNAKNKKRYVMLIEEDCNKNMIRADSQTEFAEFGLQQVTSNFEKFVCQEAQKEKCMYYKPKAKRKWKQRRVTASERRPSNLEEIITIHNSDSDDLISDRPYNKQMTVILEEVDQMELTFKKGDNRFKSMKPTINVSDGNIESAVDMNFQEEDHIQMPLEINFNKINEILDSNNFKADESVYQSISQYGSSPRKDFNKTQIDQSMNIKKEGSDKTDTTLRQQASFENILENKNQVHIEPLNDNTKENLVNAFDAFNERMKKLQDQNK